jgi:IMP dehydrogenase
MMPRVTGVGRCILHAAEKYAGRTGVTGMRLRPEPGLTFDDVLLVPRHSRVLSRSDVRTATTLVSGISLAIPIISANMDTVTEAQMAIAMARAGGLGVIHRFMTITRQAAEIARVKRVEGFVVEHPATIPQSATVGQAREAMLEGGIGGLVVIDEGRKVLGLVTRRDTLLAADPQVPILQVMTRREKLIVAPPEVDLEQARQILHRHRIEKLPLLDDQDRLHGLITAQDIIKIERFPQATKDAKGRLRVAAAIGARPSDQERAAACLQAGADLLVVDIAHGHSENSLGMVRWLKKTYPEMPVVGGNVATPEGVNDLIEAGADAVKVGVGAGSICITRLVAGCGVPQLTAIMECAQAAHERDVPLISDGGTRHSGDIVKALAAGASAVMVGSLLAGTDEAPGIPVVRNGRKYKVVRGMASITANIDRRVIEQEEVGAEWEKVVPEGIEAIVAYRGSVVDMLQQLIGGLRSGMSYAGAFNLEMLWERAEFVRLTQAGREESGPHDVTPLA